MTKLEHLEKTIEELDTKEFEAFRSWFEALQERRWDSQIDADAKSGRLDKLAAGALSEFRSGNAKPL